MTPDAELLRAGNFVSTLRFEDLVNLRYEQVDDPSAGDLARRLADRASLPPSIVSTLLLTRRTIALPHRRYAVPNPLRPENQRTEVARSPEILVVYEPGSVDDLCLLWTLRAAYGVARYAPVAAPVTADLPAVISEFRRAALVEPSLSLRPVDWAAVTSLSVGPARLDEIGAQLGIEPVPPADLLAAADRPGRTTTDLAQFSHGAARVLAWHPSDRDLLRPTARGWLSAGLVVNLRVQPQPLPPIDTFRELRAWDRTRLTNGGVETSANKADELVEIQWPSRWLTLEQAVKDHGLEVRPSQAGLVSAALLRRLGSMGSVEFLLSRPILDKLGYLSERVGISWYRKRWSEAAALLRELDEKSGRTADEILSDLHKVAVRGSDAEAHGVRSSELKRALGQAAPWWLAWAEEHGVVVRGVRLRCESCKHIFWRSLSEAAASAWCPGCGSGLKRPFPADQLTFEYRGSEALTQVARHDALPHVLALRWFVEEFREHFGEPSELFGGYPGVLLLEPGAPSEFAEIDVMLLTADGQLVPGECKARGSGLTEHDLQKLDTVCQRLDSPWSFVATPEWRHECSEVWDRAAERDAHGRQRFVLTGEQMLLRYPFDVNGGVRGRHPLNMDPLTQAECVQRAEEFARVVALQATLGTTISDPATDNYWRQ